jgi:two-component system chemotaxis sensor kinase CheA
MLAEDPALLTAFFDESLESLAGLEARLIELHKAEDGLRAEVDAIFRPVHTLKGNAPFFGFLRLQELAHALETVLDRLRTGRIGLDPGLIDLLLAGLDGLRSIVERLRDGGGEAPDEAAHADLIGRLGKAGRPQGVADAWSRLAADLADLELRDAPPEPAVLARMRQDLAAVRGSAATAPAAMPPPGDGRLACLRQRLSQPFAAPLEAGAAAAIVAELQALRAALTDPPQAAILDETIATCGVFLESVGFDDLLRQHVLEALGRLAPTPAAEAEAQPAQAPSAGSGTERHPRPDSERRNRSDSESHGRSMRVAEAAVDAFLAHVGELLVIGDLLDHLQQRVSVRMDDHGLVRDMRQAVASFAALSSELQRSIMAVRRVQVRPLLQKAPRLARDIAQATGKDIEVVLQGEATELDKGRLELIDGPLAHLVRNCADHGIEPPDRRTAAGKPARGVITVAASAAEGWFQLDIADDGKGLDLEAIRRKGEAMGLVQPGAALDQQVIVNLIFASGLSTAQRVSDVSGRGVGMDVVHRQIHEAGGTVEVTTTPGQGTRFRLRLPVAATTHIVNAFLVRCGPGVFALPLDLVRESFAYDGGGDGHGLVIRHGRTMPVVPLGRLLGQADANDGRPPGRQTVVTIERAGRNLAIAVDETLGVRRLVVRPLYGLTDGDLGGGFQGAALLGDGRLALIIAPNALCNPEAHHA